MAKEKEYRVSMAVQIPANYDVRVKAISPQEAYKKAYEDFASSGGEGEICDEDRGYTQLNMSVNGQEPDEDTDQSTISGLYITEIKEDGSEEEVR